ncbi:hypothetical protein CAL25_18570 [Bordetella genomosp. 5]|uniref:Uncharacterized protein n=1 Tax=Bordetella genomosp. 5 TaxID=1395608 RepID=A0A261TDG2_9BORD|nr:hypothetical protein CAL25_18570 [Bordetella genomosp. 5]
MAASGLAVSGFAVPGVVTPGAGAAGAAVPGAAATGSAAWAACRPSAPKARLRAAAVVLAVRNDMREAPTVKVGRAILQTGRPSCQARRFPIAGMLYELWLRVRRRMPPHPGVVRAPATGRYGIAIRCAGCSPAAFRHSR